MASYAPYKTPVYTNIDGVVYQLYAPINPLWRPAGSDRVLGGQFTPNSITPPPATYVFDPCNIAGHSNITGYALRSPAGYPLFYPLQPDPEQQKEWIAGTRQTRPDTIVYTGYPPRVVFDGQTFASDAEVQQYISRTTGGT